MSYTNQQGRQQLLDTVAEAADELGTALTALGAAYEQLSERSADELEEALFGPVQVAYGRTKRAHSEFAARHALASRTFAAPDPGHPSAGAKGFLDEAVQAVGRADSTLGTLQDSMLPVEVGDAELRASLSDIREHLTGVSTRARELVRTLGR